MIKHPPEEDDKVDLYTQTGLSVTTRVQTCWLLDQRGFAQRDFDYMQLEIIKHLYMGRNYRTMKN